MDMASTTLPLLGGMYLLTNLVALAMYAHDKAMARKGGRRSSERSLLVAALIGPFGALLGMRWFRHKTRKARFLLVPLFACLHASLLLILAI